MIFFIDVDKIYFIIYSCWEDLKKVTDNQMEAKFISNIL